METPTCEIQRLFRATFAERDTTFEPNPLAVGMKHVLVNGVLTLRDGVATGERGGRVLRGQ